MSFIYTPRDVRKELESDPKHGPMFALVLKEFDKRGFGMGVQDLGFFGSWKVSERGITIHTGASDIAKAAAWAKNGLREWAKIGITEPKQYFGEIAREWAKSQRASCTKCLGSTLDFLYLFSMNGAGRFEGTNEMYPITDSIRRDLKGILLWVFVNWWDISIVQGLDSAKVETDQSDLHPDYHDSQPGLYDEDQTHHFALYFYVGVKVGASKLLLDPVLKRTHDIDDDGNITNSGDYYLGLTAAKLGSDFDNRPRYIGDEVTRILQAPSPEKREDLRKKYEKWASNQWIHHDGDAAHPHSPSGKGGMGRFASSLPMSFEPAPGDLPHPNSPSARTLDPLKFARFANGVAES